MLKNEQSEGNARVLSRTPKEHSFEMLLAVLYFFSTRGKEEVSLAEFQESIAHLQQKVQLGFTFSERFLLSPELLSALRDLDLRGYIRDYHIRLDSLLPKRFLSMTSLGRGIGKRALCSLDPEVVEQLEAAVTFAIQNYQERWRLWAR